MADKMKIEVWSDVLCPFCYIGKKKLDDALRATSGSDRIEVEFKSFELMPGLETYPLRTTNEMLAETKGWSLEQAAQMGSQVEQLAANVGLEMDQSTSIPANTVRAHRLIHLARDHGLQTQVAQALFLAHFAQQRNIDDLDTLVEIGRTAGLDADVTRAVLESDAYTDEVRADIREARELGVTGVPFFVFDRTYAISGAQEDDVFRSTIERSLTEWEARHPASPFELVQEGQSCSVDGTCAP
ncbi:DsbA family oxidoreductase [Corynebacterium pacaense]|uniref:DsbA family oxidoreductase n=1 Tax=Corynebacterium pacaense TaxID=1816684 RepID=UPI001FE25BF3|nr:DsbA family oxidoreductase [Corynebacterium pacaense]